MSTYTQFLIDKLTMNQAGPNTLNLLINIVIYKNILN